MENNKVWKKAIQNMKETPWLDWIACGKKKYEGRIYREDWKDMRINDIIIFYNQDQEVKVKITDLKFFANFRLAYNELKDSLIPIENCDEKIASEIYTRIFHKEQDQIDLEKYGVIAIGMMVIH